MAANIAKTKTGIGRQAVVTQRQGLFEVKLYSTYIYSEEADKITLDNGGWITATTARYISQALAYRGISNRVCIRKGEMVLLCTRSVVPFKNGRLVMGRYEKAVL